jgi:hypothetical protein
LAAGWSARSSGALVVGHPLRDFELAAVPQVLRDAGSAEGMLLIFGLDAGVEGAVGPIMR